MPPASSRITPRCVLLAALSLLIGGCGGAQPEPHASGPAASAPDGPVRGARPKGSGESSEPKVTAAVGGLPPEGVAETFQRAQDKLERCFLRGLGRVDMIGGAVKFWVKVDLKGKFMHAHLEQSDLGDRTTEQCLLDQLMAQRWPTPVGGKVGIATFSMSFEAASDVVVPERWPAEKASEVLRALAEPIDECKSGLPGDFTATVYVKRNDATGVTITASATPPDEAGEMAVDCLVGVLQKATWPAPVDKPAKIVFKM